MPNLSGIERIAAERQRQIALDGKCFTAERDDLYVNDQLLRAACAYAIASLTNTLVTNFASRFWPWSHDSFTPRSRIRNLERAGALIAAEIDRLLRAGE